MEKLLRSNGLIVGGIFVTAFFILIAVSNIEMGIVVPIIFGAILLSWIATRVFKPTKPDSNAKPRISNQDVRELRGQVLENLADALPRAIVGLDPNTEVIYANQSAFDMLSPDIIGRPIGAYLRTSKHCS